VKDPASAEPTAGGRFSPNAAGARPIRAVFFGSGSFAIPILHALMTIPGIRVEAVVSAPDRPVGRKAVLTPTPVAARARELGLPLLQPARVRAADSVAALQALAPDLAVLADYGQLIPRVLLDLPPRGFLNLHPSELPRHRGAAPIPATILAGDTHSAVTLMVVSEEMDAGPIVATAPLEVRPDDTSPVLEERAAGVAAALLERAVPAWLAGRLTPVPQPAEGVTLTRLLRREDARLDPAAKLAVELERQIRAYQPWPGSFLELPNAHLIVKSATAVPGDASGSATGRVISRDGHLDVATAGGWLRLGIVQMPGKSPVTAAEFGRGYPGMIESNPGDAV
jgi:methionyl-tRNA formyltransferase